MRFQSSPIMQDEIFVEMKRVLRIPEQGLSLLTWVFPKPHWNKHRPNAVIFISLVEPDITKDYKQLLHCNMCTFYLVSSPHDIKLMQLKHQQLIFPLSMETYLWKLRLEASGAYPSIKMDTISLDTAAGEVDSRG